MYGRKKEKVTKVLLQIVLILISLVIVIPLLIMLLGAFKNSAEVTAFDLTLPEQWLVDNFKTVFEQGKLLLAFKNSILITIASTVITIFTSSLASFILARRKTRFSRFLYYFFFIGTIIPMQIMPTIRLFTVLDIYGGYLNVIILYTAINIPFSCFLYTGFIRGIPGVLDESAFIEGASTLQTYFYIILPLLKSCNITVLILLFTGIWNEINIPLYFLNDPAKRTLPLSVYQFFGMYGGSNWNLVFADLTLAALPVILLFLFMQKQFISGLTEGAVKG
ncbi:carbohydrate ABC transporter permease [Muricomes sp. OA1]|uniref:Carbohydrate ABC transporter permease n=2 Tax=Lachnospiraceae TaxID=186803 RepID=A0A3E2WWL9_9FIRM|nr:MULTISPECIES: carbohydrate ABC transporter permease [Clostridia]MCH1975218.1 carbohydrate ABC transporter permease [Muricomes sp. OA1]MEE0199449.1 carbohydrate ABC transporter permease [Muricomes sp.]RGC32125.1 carbohydrate ABC transporter permease [Hungatella hathewayi]GKH34052.1 sugar ABC transporter permease [Faecalicatena contorta]